MFGMTTYYRLVEGKLYCKVQGEFQNCVIFDQMAVIREGDLYNTWAPFVSKSSLLKRFSDTEMAAHFTLSMPVLVRSVVLRVLSFTRFSSINPRPLTGRDAVVMGYCVDMSENDQILLMADSVDAIPGVELPPKPSSWLPTDRMDVQKFPVPHRHHRAHLWSSHPVRHSGSQDQPTRCPHQLRDPRSWLEFSSISSRRLLGRSRPTPSRTLMPRRSGRRPSIASGCSLVPSGTAGRRAGSTPRSLRWMVWCRPLPAPRRSPLTGPTDQDQCPGSPSHRQLLTRSRSH
jgi:hypothetical protein